MENNKKKRMAQLAFALEAENDHVWGKIGDHVFCRQYIWE